MNAHHGYTVVERKLGEKRGHTVATRSTMDEARDEASFRATGAPHGTTEVVYSHHPSMPYDNWFYVKCENEVLVASRHWNRPNHKRLDEWKKVFGLSQQYMGKVGVAA